MNLVTRTIRDEAAERESTWELKINHSYVTYTWYKTQNHETNQTIQLTEWGRVHSSSSSVLHRYRLSRSRRCWGKTSNLCRREMWRFWRRWKLYFLNGIEFVFHYLPGLLQFRRPSVLQNRPNSADELSSHVLKHNHAYI